MEQSVVSGQTPARETVALKKLVTDGGTQVRPEISEYSDALTEGARFPSVVVFRAKGGEGARRRLGRTQRTWRGNFSAGREPDTPGR